MSSVLQEGHPIYQDTRDSLPVGWASGDEAFLSGVGNPPAPEALLPLVSLCSASSGASIKQSIKELPHNYSVVIVLGSEDAGSSQLVCMEAPQTTSAIRPASLRFVASAFASELGYDSQGPDWLYAVQ